MLRLVVSYPSLSSWLLHSSKARRVLGLLCFARGESLFKQGLILDSSRASKAETSVHNMFRCLVGARDHSDGMLGCAQK